MEDIIRALLDVVRAQHSATEGTEEAPFDMNDIVDMAMNILGRPDESEEVAEMIDSIQKLVETLAPDIFPPKTFEEMDDAERAASAASMIEERLRKGMSGGRNASATQDTNAAQSTNAAQDRSAAQDTGIADTFSADGANTDNVSKSGDGQEAQDGSAQEGQEETFDAQQTAELNDLIYKNLMEMMGMQSPQVEYPFDPSQIQYGREKSITQMLEEERQEEERLREEQKAMDARVRSVIGQPSSPSPGSASASEGDSRSRSAWELAQDAVDRDEKAHEKEPYIPQVRDEEPTTKSASQLAAEAIRRAQEEDREKLEIEKQAERLMEEARRRGQDPMKFALHQQEILQYMEKNSDELVSFEDYEDLSPEEKYEIERQIHIEKQLADGVHPDEVDEQVPEEFIPQEMRTAMAAAQAAQAAQAAEESDSGDMVSGAGDTPAGQVSAVEAGNVPPVLTEEMLRQLSQEVIRENSDMILSDNENEDMESLNDLIMANIKTMMSGSGAAVRQEDVGELLEQAAAAAKGATEAPQETQGLSAVELARAAQAAAKPEPEVVKEGKSAVELAKEAQEKAKKAREAEGNIADGVQAEAASADTSAAQTTDTGKTQDSAAEESLRDEDATEAGAEESLRDEDVTEAGAEESLRDEDATEAGAEESLRDENVSEVEAEELHSDESVSETGEAQAETAEEPEEEYEYVDPDELVLGEHTQAEIDEAIDNLNSLGLEGEVYERAKRMLLLELAGSEAELDAWLREQENGKKKKATVSALDDDDSFAMDDLDDFDEDMLEKELELAMDEDFLEEEDSEENEADSAGETTGDSDADDDETAEEAMDSSDDESETDESSNADETAEEAMEESEAVGEEETADIISEVEVEDTIPTPNAGSERETGKKTAQSASRKKVVKKRAKKDAGEKKAEDRMSFNAEARKSWTDSEQPAQAKEYQVSLRHPFILKNSASFMDQFESYIQDTQENRRLSTGFKKLDAMLRYGLHKGTYFIDSDPQYLKNSFMQQIADRAAESGVDVLYISTELSRYDLMVETISRLSFEMHRGDTEQAVSAMDIMTGEKGADLASLKDELNWYRGRISEHLYILDQEAVSQYTDAVEEISAGDILAELIRSIVREGAHKPVVFIDNIENILSMEDIQDMKPLMEGIRRLAGELGIPILMSYGYAQAETETELSAAEREFHETLGNLCDVYMELTYADMITEDSVELTEEDIQEMMEDGETLLINVLLHRNRRPLRASCQIQGTPRYNYYEE